MYNSKIKVVLIAYRLSKTFDMGMLALARE
jgi:hypothetical protein